MVEGRVVQPQGNRLYNDHLFPTPTRRAQLHALAFEDRAEKTSDDYPLVLTTGRIREQWHTMTKTGRVNRLRAHVDTPFCEIHPADAAGRAIADDEIMTITNPRGSVRVRASVTADIRQGVIFLPMHWAKRLTPDAPPNRHATARANNLTSPRLDPVSKEPDLKFAAVQAARYAPPKRRIVIIGAGAAAHAFIRHHRRHNPHDSIILLGGESLPLYNRVMLPHYIDGSAPWDALITADHDALQPHRVVFHSNTLVSRVDRAAKSVTDARGRSFAYDVLVFATGSRPAVHYDGPVPESGVFTLRSRGDADAILAAALPGRRAVVHGGGLLGVELADALAHLGCHVTILQRSDRLMSKQLDATASGHLAEELALRGIEVLFNTAPIELQGAQSIEAVRLQSKSENQPSKIPCDLFIFATGTLPNKELAGAAGLDCAKGILVNAHLQTSDPQVFAIGECSQHGDHLAGTTADADLQGLALAEFLRGHDHAPYDPRPQASILKVRGLQLAVAGITDPPADNASFEVITLHDARRRHYQKCIVKDDRLVGAICLGDARGFPKYLEWMQSGLELEDLRPKLLRAEAELPPLDGPLVCSCHQVGAGTIEKAAPGCGGDLQSVCAATKAGAGCGSCRPEVAAILARVKSLRESLAQPARRGIRT